LQYISGSGDRAVPQDLKFGGENTSVEIGDHTTIREGVTYSPGHQAPFQNQHWLHCLLMAYSHVAHDCLVGDHVILANAVQLAGHVEVGDYAIIGGLCGVQQFTRIGKHAYIGGQSAIRKDVPPYVKAAREPISYMGINVVGLHRRNFPHHQIEMISQIYHLLFVGNHSTSSGITLVNDKIPESELKTEILQFIKESKTGIIRRYSKNMVDED
jgi:UDP-N-acetylglucosamine acyltransferase